MRAALFVLLLSQPLLAQSPLPAGGRTAADVASYVTLGATIALDTRASWECADRVRCFALQGVRIGVTEAAVLLLKHYVHEDRPCAPDCGIDQPHTSFCSGHTANAFQAIGRKRLAFTLPLATGTGGLRWLANKHWPRDVAACAGIGLLVGMIR